MKFGKTLQRSSKLSHPTWSESWVNYKGLKKLIKDICKEEKLTGAGTKQPAIVSQDDNVEKIISSSAGEVAFFRRLRAELQKIATFFIEEENKYIARAESLEKSYLRLKEANELDQEVSTHLMSECVAFYKELMLLEHYAVMNYCGLSKILKKHDRWTGHDTRSKYMNKVVNKQQFSTYPRLQSLLARTEKLFALMTNRSIEHHEGQAQPSTEQETDSGVSTVVGPRSEDSPTLTMRDIQLMKDDGQRFRNKEAHSNSAKEQDAESEDDPSSVGSRRSSASEGEKKDALSDSGTLLSSAENQRTLRKRKLSDGSSSGQDEPEQGPRQKRSIGSFS